MYKLIIKPSAQKDLDKLPVKELNRIAIKLNQLSEEARPIGNQKLSNNEGYRIRSGNFRVLYEVDDKQKTISVYRIKHRKDAYK